MRFIFNFFFFGFIFYLIWLFFPDAFHTLEGWAGAVYEFFKGIIENISNKAAHTTPTPPAAH